MTHSCMLLGAGSSQNTVAWLSDCKDDGERIVLSVLQDTFNVALQLKIIYLSGCAFHLVYLVKLTGAMIRALMIKATPILFSDKVTLLICQT